MLLHDVPGYTKATERGARLEASTREFAFLGATERICGIPVRQLTLRMFLQLDNARNPFIAGGRVREEDVGVFLWRISPDYTTSQELEPLTRGQYCRRAITRFFGRSVPPRRTVAQAARVRFAEQIRHVSFDRARRAIDRWLTYRMLLDQPPRRRGARISESDTSFAADMVHEFAVSYGWSEDDVLNCAMPRLFQYLRKVQRDRAAAAGKDFPRLNPLQVRLQRRIERRLAKQQEEELNSKATNPEKGNGENAPQPAEPVSSES